MYKIKKNKFPTKIKRQGIEKLIKIKNKIREMTRVKNCLNIINAQMLCMFAYVCHTYSIQDLIHVRLIKAIKMRRAARYICNLLTKYE